VTNVVVADAGPLIGMARIGHLSLLQSLYNVITISPRVFEELKISSDKPGAKAASEAINAGWIRVVTLKRPSDSAILGSLIDAGEAESIQLALEQKARLLIIDDKKGRRAAKSRGAQVIGTEGILISAKKAGFLRKVSPILDELASVGYRLSPALCNRIIELAEEGHNAK
jgi:predicted nucleic acid-binding protein